MSFAQKLRTRMKSKNSIVCAGLDPAEYVMGRGAEGLPRDISKKEWALAYVEAVAPFCAGVKYNVNYWKSSVDMEVLCEVIDVAHASGLLVIEDAKLGDIGDSNEAGMFYASQKGVDAVTMSPFAGNIMEAAVCARKSNLGVIALCIMSNPEYEREKQKLVMVGQDSFRSEDVVSCKGSRYVRQYIHLAKHAADAHADGIVVGAPSEHNHITEDELDGIKYYISDSMIVLVPGMGIQGGCPEQLWQSFGKDQVLVNIGRALMFPKDSAPAEQAQAYQQLLNTWRYAS